MTKRAPLVSRKWFAPTALLALAGLTPAHAMDPFTIDDIRVEGLQRTSIGTVFNYLPVQIGDTVNRPLAAESIRALFQTGFFQDVSLARDGETLVVTVVERPSIAEINLEGNKDIKSEDLLRALEDMGFAQGEVYQPITLDRIKQSLTGEYLNRGKYNVAVESEVTDLERNRVKVDINVTEGKAAKIKHINIVGNTVFTDEEILESFESNTSNFTSWYSKDDQYSQEKLTGDLEKLRSYYQDRGYIDFEIESSQVSISPDRKGVYITANVREGEIYDVSEINMTGEFPIDEASLKQLVILRPGDTFSRELLERSTENITALLSNIGFAFANVEPRPELDKESRTVKLNLFVEPGNRVTVRRVVFNGNESTKDEVLRREMRQFEGGWFSQTLIDRSKLRLQRLPYMEEVNIETPRVPGTEDQVDVVVSVKERLAGQFSFGLGYSGTFGASTSLQVSQENFLGSGKRFDIGLNRSSFFTNFSLGFQNPYWSDDGISRGYNVFFRNTEQEEANLARFSTDSWGGSMNFGIPLTEFGRLGLSIGVDDVELSAFSSSGEQIIDELQFYDLIATEPDLFGRFSPEGSALTYRSQLSWTKDSRNRFFNPTSGGINRAGLEVALPGSTIEFYKLNLTSKNYFPINRYLTLAVGGEIGYGDTYGESDNSDFGLPFFEHFYAGGVRSVRGFEDNTLGPRTVIARADNGDPIFSNRALGGDLKLTGTVEVAFPTPFSKGDTSAARLAWFFDVGQIYQDLDAFEADDLRYSTGLSLTWQAPVGPIVINLVETLNDEEDDRTEGLQFAFGNFF